MRGILQLLLLTFAVATGLASPDVRATTDDSWKTIPDCVTGEPIRYRISAGYAVIGDVLLARAESIERGCLTTPAYRRIEPKSNPRPTPLQCSGLPFDSDRAACADLWSGAVVPYKIDGNVRAAYRSEIARAIAHYQTYTGISFVPASGDADYFVNFREDGLNPGICGASHVGRLPPGRVLGIIVVKGQDLQLATDPGCGPQIFRTLVHEMGHALGLYHEHQRYDRDNYVNVTCQEVPNGDDYGRKGYVAPGPYDYVSVMHYFQSSCLTPKGPLPSVPNPRCGPNYASQMGNDCLSDLDVQGLRRYYNLDKPSGSISPAALAAAMRILNAKPAVTVTAVAVEYFHQNFGHYFISSDADEIGKLDSGFFSGWARTGQTFKVYTANPAAADVCRFFTVAFAPKSSHFYTPIASECAKVKDNPDWQYEKIAFKLLLPTGAGCPAGTVPLYRLYNNGKTGAPNHRYTTSTAIRDQTLAGGFVLEADNTACVPQ